MPTHISKFVFDGFIKRHVELKRKLSLPSLSFTKAGVLAVTPNSQICKTTYKHDKNDLRIINHYDKSLLFSDNKTWKKKSTECCFDVTMGSFDGAEICKLVGLYVQSKLEKIFPKSNFELYRADELALLRNLNKQQTKKFSI